MKPLTRARTPPGLQPLAARACSASFHSSVFPSSPANLSFSPSKISICQLNKATPALSCIVNLVIHRQLTLDCANQLSKNVFIASLFHCMILIT